MTNRTWGEYTFPILFADDANRAFEMINKRFGWVYKNGCQAWAIEYLEDIVEDYVSKFGDDPGVENWVKSIERFWGRCSG